MYMVGGYSQGEGGWVPSPRTPKWNPVMHYRLQFIIAQMDASKIIFPEFQVSFIARSIHVSDAICYPFRKLNTPPTHPPGYNHSPSLVLYVV